MDEPEVLTAVDSALTRVISRDADLLLFDANERTITHRLGMYLEDEIGDYWEVDVEYNRRDGEEEITKRIPPQKLPDSRNGSVYPDVIIHKRGSTADNLAVIEVKKSNSREVGDQQKVRAYMEYLDYDHGLFVELEISADPDDIDYTIEPQ